MKRGDIYWADLKPRSGSEQAGRRPVIIMSHDGFNRISSWHSINVIPLSTSTNQARRGPTAISLNASKTGLHKDSIALCHQITTIDRRKLTNYIATLPKCLLIDVEEGLRIALGL